MKRWALVVVALYFLILVAITFPLIKVAFHPLDSSTSSLATIENGLYWVILGVFTLAQGVMLVVPVNISMRRPESHRSILWLVLAAGLMVGILGLGVVLSVNEFIRREHADVMNLAIPWGVLLGLWTLWTVMFYSAGRNRPAMDVITQQCSYLLKGSILELLVAVPTHIVARSRDYCCAGVYTFLGIAFGVAVMLFSYGPGVFFLFASRWRRLHPQKAEAAS
ncbi:MAG: hypothetical protein WA830_05980 [Candidatus Sulfotelmatobacter sp.]